VNGEGNHWILNSFIADIKEKVKNILVYDCFSNLDELEDEFSSDKF